jgi:hypothetical protein
VFFAPVPPDFFTIPIIPFAFLLVPTEAALTILELSVTIANIVPVLLEIISTPMWRPVYQDVLPI